MARSIPALVNPSLLEWARKDAGYSPDDAATLLGVPVAKIHAWETGDAKPTLRQAEKLAKAYHRTYSVLCLPAPPPTTPLAAQYRRLKGVKPGAESPDLRFGLRQMIQRRKTALYLMEELGAAPAPFKLRASLNEPAERVADRVRKGLGVTVDEQTGRPHEYRAWRRWREAVEKLGVLVFQFSEVAVDEVRGVSLFDFPEPAIGVNIKDVPASKPFTLVHELAHLALANADEEKPALQDDRPESEWTRSEAFAEEVAGAVLMPRLVLEADPALASGTAAHRWTVDEVRSLARRYKVTPLAFITRLLRMGRCTPAHYDAWKRAWSAYLADRPPRKGGGFATPAEKSLSRNGPSFTRLVLEALCQDRITALDAAQHLRLGYPHIERLRLATAFSRPHAARRILQGGPRAEPGARGPLRGQPSRDHAAASLFATLGRVP